MSLSNSPDPALRDAVVRQDLGNVLHPIVQHKVLETKQMVITASEGSTVVDADGTGYLDGMAGLWCVNIGYGRSDLGELAAAIADIDAPQPGHAVEIAGAVGVDHRRALARGDHHLLGFQDLVLHDRVQNVAEVLAHDRVAQRGIGRIRQRHDRLVGLAGGWDAKASSDRTRTSLPRRRRASGQFDVGSKRLPRDRVSAASTERWSAAREARPGRVPAALRQPRARA